jgi:Flp pilus assembly protein TadD
MAHTAQVQSMMLLGQATIAAQKGNEKTASDAMAEALEIWPTNPKLMSGASSYFSQKDEGNELTSDFDRDVRDQNYRAIYEKALAFGPAVKDDPARVQQLKDAVEKVKTAEAATEKANYMVINGDVNGAWETIELATKDWPDDMRLNKLLADLSGRSADFVSALNKAHDAEAKKELGYSLTWYVNAQNFYPPSQIANDGIDRVSKLILSPPSSSTAADAN